MRGLLAERGTRTFLLVWAGQLVSLVGSGLTAFALGVWIFQRTASTTQYALVTFCAAVPPLVVLPLAGPLIDRCRRKQLLIACDLTGALATAAVGVLAWKGLLSLPLACVFVAVNAGASALQWPTWAATVTLLVPQQHLGRASGMTSLAMAVSQVVAPLAAGALLSVIGLWGITAIDLGTFVFSVAMLAVATVPGAVGSGGGRPSYGRDLLLGWRFIFDHRGLSALLLVFAATNFLTELATVLFTPLVLCLSTPAALGTILATGGVGMVAGGALLSAWGGPRRPALGATLVAALSGAIVVLAGITTSVVGLAAVAAAFFLLVPVVAGANQVVWQSTVPAPLQGRVFAVRSTLAMAAVPLASLAAGPLADRVFEPAMHGGTLLAQTFGPLFGLGRGRGIALLIALSGVLCVGVALAGAMFAPLRELDRAPSRPAPLAAAADAGG